MVATHNSKELRIIDIDNADKLKDSLERNKIILIAENVLDTYNVGGIFRLADSLAAQAVFLTGATPCPPNNRIHKASCGTYKVVPWQYFTDTTEAIAHIRTMKRQYGIYAIEQSPHSVVYRDIQPQLPVALIVGNETYGVAQKTLAIVDNVIEIPMYGINKSLNVIVSAGIVSHYYLVSKQA